MALYTPQPPATRSEEKERVTAPSVGERYDFIKDHLLHHDKKITKAFESWTVQLSATIGAVLALRFQYGQTALDSKLRFAGVAVVVLITAVSLLLIWINMSAWVGFRRAEVAVNPGAPEITCKSYRGEVTMTIVELITLAGAVWFIRVL